MSFEVAAAALNPSSATTAAPGAAGGSMQAGYNVSFTDINGFQQSMTNAGVRLEARGVEQTSNVAEQLMKPFSHINTEAKGLADQANVAKAEGRDMTPSEIVSLSVRCQEFMFHCQLTSNIANKTSDGVSQLFRQQS